MPDIETPLDPLEEQNKAARAREEARQAEEKKANEDMMRSMNVPNYVLYSWAKQKEQQGEGEKLDINSRDPNVSALAFLEQNKESIAIVSNLTKKLTTPDQNGQYQEISKKEIDQTIAESRKIVASVPKEKVAEWKKSIKETDLSSLGLEDVSRGEGKEPRSTLLPIDHERAQERFDSLSAKKDRSAEEQMHLDGLAEALTKLNAWVKHSEAQMHDTHSEMRAQIHSKSKETLRETQQEVKQKDKATHHQEILEEKRVAAEERKAGSSEFSDSARKLIEAAKAIEKQKGEGYRLEAADVHHHAEYAMLTEAGEQIYHGKRKSLDKASQVSDITVSKGEIIAGAKDVSGNIAYEMAALRHEIALKKEMPGVSKEDLERLEKMVSGTEKAITSIQGGEEHRVEARADRISQELPRLIDAKEKSERQTPQGTASKLVSGVCGAVEAAASLLLPDAWNQEAAKKEIEQTRSAGKRDRKPEQMEKENAGKRDEAKSAAQMMQQTLSSVSSTAGAGDQQRINALAKQNGALEGKGASGDMQPKK